MTKPVGAWHGAVVALVCGSLILLVSLGVRHTFGLFLQPVTMDQGWGRETFAFAIALQNLVWGASQPFTGVIADRYGAKPVVAAGAVLYGLGLYTMSQVAGETVFILGAGVLIGLGLSGTTFPGDIRRDQQIGLTATTFACHGYYDVGWLFRAIRDAAAKPRTDHCVRVANSIDYPCWPDSSHAAVRFGHSQHARQARLR